MDRPSRRVSKYECLPRDIELGITCVIEKEIDLARKMEVLKKDI